MFTLIRINDRYCLTNDDFEFEGNFINTVNKMIDLLKHLNQQNCIREITKGMKAVEYHDYAEYGEDGKFLFSSNF